MSDQLFVKKILDLLPQLWRRRFNADRALEVFTLDDFIDMTYGFMPKENINSIMRLCIEASHPDDESYDGNTPFATLSMLQYKGAKFNGELYKLTHSKKCIDSERILALFCDLPVIKIQRTWLRYHEWKHHRATQIISKKVKEWLYRPGGPMMRKFEKNFNQLAISQHMN